MELLFERFLLRNAANGRILISTFPSATTRACHSIMCTSVYGELGAAMTANVITYRREVLQRASGEKHWGFDAEP